MFTYFEKLTATIASLAGLRFSVRCAYKQTMNYTFFNPLEMGSGEKKVFVRNHLLIGFYRWFKWDLNVLRRICRTVSVGLYSGKCDE